MSSNAPGVHHGPLRAHDWGGVLDYLLVRKGGLEPPPAKADKNLNPELSLLTTTSYNTQSLITIRSKGTYEQSKSPRSVACCCRELAFVEFKCTRSALWKARWRSTSIRRHEALQVFDPVEDNDERCGFTSAADRSRWGHCAEEDLELGTILSDTMEHV